MNAMQNDFKEDAPNPESKDRENDRYTIPQRSSLRAGWITCGHGTRQSFADRDKPVLILAIVLVVVVCAGFLWSAQTPIQKHGTGFRPRRDRRWI